MIKSMYLKYNIQLQKYLSSYINSNNDHKIDYNHNAAPKLGNLVVVLNSDLKFFSSVSSRKLKCLSSAWLELEKKSSLELRFYLDTI